MSLTFKRIKHSGISYYVQQAGLTKIGADDYYSQAVANGEASGVVFDPGGLLDRFGIKQGDEISAEEFQRLMKGYDPFGNKFSATQDDKHRPGYDLTAGATKAASAIWAACLDLELRDKIEAEIMRANLRAMEFLNEKAGYIRTGAQGKGQDEKADLLIFQYMHKSSRAGDPHLHIHNVVANISSNSEGKIVTINSFPLTQWRKAAGCIFGAAFAKGLQKIFPGLEVEIRENGTYTFKQIPEELQQFWSKSSTKILLAAQNVTEAEAESMSEDDMRELLREARKTPAEIRDALAIKVRQKKAYDELPEEMDARWLREAAEHGFTQESIEALKLKPENPEKVDLDAVVKGIPTMLTENESVFTLQELYAAIAQQTTGELDADQIESLVEVMAGSGINHKTIKFNEEAGNGIRNEYRIDGYRPGILGFTGGGGDPESVAEEDEVAEIIAARGAGTVLRQVSAGNLADLATRAGDDSAESILQADASPRGGSLAGVRGQGALDEVDPALVSWGENDSTTIVSLGENKAKQKVFTTLEMIKIEYRLQNLAAELSTDEKHSVPQKSIDAILDKYPTMSDEQRAAFLHTAQPGSIKTVEGGAGTGKTFTLAAVNELYQNLGYQVIGTAISNEASRVLKHDAKLSDAYSVAKLLTDIGSGKQKLSPKTLVIVDEAGLVGSRDAEKLIAVTKAAGAKILFTGDEQQLKPVAAGGALKLIKEQTGSVRITEIRRQKEEWQREMVAAFDAYKASKAVPFLVEHERIKFLNSRDETIVALSKACFDATNQGRNTLALAITRQDVRELNKSIRDLRKAAGQLPAEEILLKSTLGPAMYSIGDVIRLKKNDSKLKVVNMDQATITGITPRGAENFLLEVRLENGKTIELDTSKYRDEEGRVALQHGYAITVHASQGRTVDDVFVLHSSNIDAAAAYVACSRHRDNVTIFVDQEEMRHDILEEREDSEINSAVTHKDIVSQMVGTYGRVQEKRSTLEYLAENQTLSAAVTRKIAEGIQPESGKPEKKVLQFNLDPENLYKAMGIGFLRQAAYDQAAKILADLKEQSAKFAEKFRLLRQAKVAKQTVI